MFDLTGHSKEKQRLFMDRQQQKLIGGEKNGRNKINTREPYLSVLHQNVQSIGNKQIEVDLALKSNGNNIDVLCFTEHWLKEDCEINSVGSVQTSELL